MKIGVAKHATQRLSDMQVGCPFPLTLLKVIAGEYAEEAALHGRFAEYTMRGEWFKLEPLREYIAGLPSYSDGRLPLPPCVDCGAARSLKLVGGFSRKSKAVLCQKCSRKAQLGRRKLGPCCICGCASERYRSGGDYPYVCEQHREELKQERFRVGREKQINGLARAYENGFIKPRRKNGAIRLEILALFTDGTEKTQTEIRRAFGSNNGQVVKVLAMLTNAGLLKVRKGRRPTGPACLFYSLAQ